MYKFIISILLLLSSHVLKAHNASILGKIIEANRNSPVEGVIIQIEPKSIQTSTNAGGYYQFSGLEKGEYQISIYCLGYQGKQFTVNLSDHENYVLDIALERSTTQLKELKIKSNHINNINAISKVDIAMRPVNSAQDVLRMVPGLFIAQHAGGGKSEQIFMRGFDCDHGTDIALSVDGMPVNMVSHAHGQGYADLHFLIPETIDRIQVNKGNYEAQDGNFATAGAVKFSTKKILDHNFISLEGGSFNQARGVMLLNLFPEKLKKKNQHLYLASEYYYRQGFFDNPDHLHRANGMLKYYGQWSKHHQVLMQLSHFTSNWNASGQIPQRAVDQGLITRFGSIDPTEGGSTQRTNASIKSILDLHRGRTWINQVYFSRYHFNLFSNFTFYANDSLEGDKIQQHEKRNIMGYSSQYFTQHKIAGYDIQTEIGLQSRYDDIMDNQLSGVARNEDLLQRYAYGDVKELNLALYLNEQIHLNKKWKLNIGLREDLFMVSYLDKISGQKSNQTKTRFSPKFQLYYNPTDKAQWFLHAGMGFHSNDTRTVVSEPSVSIIPPAYGAEIGLQYKVLPSLLFTGSLWWLYLQQEFVYVGDEAIVEVSGKTRRMGLDVVGRWNIFSWLNADADLNISIPRAIDAGEEGNRIPLAPSLTSVGGLNIQINKGLKVALRYRYMADRPGNESNTQVAKGYFIKDAVAEYNYGKWVVGLTAENLFNVKWKEAQFETESKLKNETEPVTEMNFTAGTPRALKLKLGFRF